MAHTTCGSEKTDGGKHSRARPWGERGQGQSLWIDLCVPPALPRTPRRAAPSPPSVSRIPHPQFVPLGVGVGRVVCRVHRAQVPCLGGPLGDVLEAGRR